MPDRERKVRSDRKYDWDRWLADDRVVLRRGEHYVCDMYSFGLQLRNAATRLGVKISVEIDPDSDDFVVTVKERQGASVPT